MALRFVLLSIAALEENIDPAATASSSLSPCSGLTNVSIPSLLILESRARDGHWLYKCIMVNFEVCGITIHSGAACFKRTNASLSSRYS